MRHLDLPTGHRIYYNDDLNHIMGAIEQATLSLGAFLDQNYYMQDTVIEIDVNTSCPAGAMIFNGELCYFDEQDIPTIAGDLYWVELITYDDATQPIQDISGNDYTPRPERKVMLQYSAAPPTDPYVLATNAKQPNEALAARLVGSWVEVGDEGTAFEADWSHGTDPGNEAYLRRNKAQKSIQFKGLAVFTGSISADTFKAIFTIPPGDNRVNRSVSGVVQIIDAGSGSPICFAHISANSAGQVGISTPIDLQDPTVILDGVCLFE